MSQIRITQERSEIRCLERHKRTLVALGLRRMNHSVIHNDTPQIRGMVDQVRYLVRVEPVDVGGAGTGAVVPAARGISKRPPSKKPAGKRPPRKRIAAKRAAAKRATAKRATTARGAKPAAAKRKTGGAAGAKPSGSKRGGTR